MEPTPAGPSASRSKAMRDEVWSAAFSPDGKAHRERRRRTNGALWEADTGKLIGRPLKGHVDLC